MSFRAPLARGLTRLDRSLFSKTINLAAASTTDVRDLSRYRVQLQKRREILALPSVDVIRINPLNSSRKCLLLQPGIKAEGMGLISCLGLELEC